MDYSHSNIIEISDNSFIGLTDTIVYVALNFGCKCDKCENSANNFCVLSELLKASEGRQIEHTVERYNTGTIAISLTYQGKDSYFEFLEVITDLNRKMEEMEFYIKSECLLKDELIKIQTGFQNYLDNLINSIQDEA